jgi:UDP-2,3-diacylglucosamine hydrolase
MTKPFKIYFVSDLHLGTPDKESSFRREKRFVAWLDSVKGDAAEIYLLGDIFDMWFEYKRVIPRGYSRLLGKFAELADKGVVFHYFTGNHDMWIGDYFTTEFGMKIYRKPVVRTINGKKFFIGHGDGLGPGDYGYKFIKRVFAGKLNQWLYARLHPNFALGLADFFSRRSRAATGNNDEVFVSEEKEMLVRFARQYLEIEHIDYFVFGHRHLKLDIKISENSRYINTGQWITGSSYAVFDGNQLLLSDF